MTGLILERGAKLTAIEIDRRLAGELMLSHPGLEVTVEDATKVLWPACDVFISNVPYHVTSPILMRLLEHDYKRAVLTVQKEYAERMVAGPGTKDYSRLSIAVYCRAVCENLGTLPPGAFSPPPKVSSSIVRLRPRRFPFKVMDRKLYYELVRVLFSHRRKMIGTTLRRSFGVPTGVDVPFERQRVEELAPEEIAKIADAVAMSRRASG